MNPLATIDLEVCARCRHLSSVLTWLFDAIYEGTTPPKRALGSLPCASPLTSHEASPRVLGLPEGRHAEEPFELPAELRWALVADRPRGGARIVPVVGHEPPRLVEPDPLEVLQGGAGRHELEVVMEGRHAHARPLRHVLSAERLRVLGVEVFQDPSDSAEVRVPAGQGTERPALLAAQHAIDDFADRLWRPSMRLSSGHFRHSRSRMTATLNASLIGVVEMPRVF
jgi:hypothetical protein